MRKAFAIFILVLTTIIIVVLDRPLGNLPALGRLLDPMNGAWASAESTNEDFNLNTSLPGLSSPVTVQFDERMVPHITAASDKDLYYIQGYTHAYFRLFQMDLQTRAAGGRLCEVVGEKALKLDRTQRRKGMVYAAENSLRVMEADPRTKQMLDAYTAGVNNYIRSLNYRELPIEYKLIGFKPEPWTNIKCALLLKYMADDLTGNTEDIQLTLLRDQFGADNSKAFAKLYPEKVEGSTPVIPIGIIHQQPSLQPLKPPADSVAFAHLNATTDFETEDNEGKGSNNWVVSGSRTESGAAILANDPHLGLNLPSLWFEVQLTAPGLNVYGASLPGAPGVVIGFNDNISWGFTNNYRDVKDFYAIKPSADYNSYLFNGKQTPFTNRVERIRIKGKGDFLDTVRYTVHGPVMYEEKFHGPGGLKVPLAMTWMAHKGTNELLSLYLLNRSGNYSQFVTAIQQFLCPAQNMAYADRQGNIALWGQGQFVNKWKGQGRYVMNGTDSSTLWKELIPVQENPHVLNPQQGFISSANQSVTDDTYPYWYNGTFYEFRAWRINQVLSALQKASVKDMFALQNDVHSYLAAKVLPVMLQYLPSVIAADQQKAIATLRKWDHNLTAESETATIFQVWWHFFHKRHSNLGKSLPVVQPLMGEVVMQALLDAPAKGAASVNTESAYLQESFIDAMDSLAKIKDTKWYHVKNTTITHLARLPAFSYTDLKTGGWGNTPNAMKGNHGPSWRMVVQMGETIEAYGVYPGGQSGNPGSRYYADYLDKWVNGEYYKLNFVAADKKSVDKVKYTWKVQPK